MVRTRPLRKAVKGDDAGKNFGAKKTSYRARAITYFEQYNKIMVVLCDNVQSRQMQHIRQDLRGKAIVLMGKNTAIKKILLDLAATGDERYESMYRKLTPLLKDNVGLIFTNEDLVEVKELVEKWRIQAMARSGVVAPCDVIVPAGDTGMEPMKTSFFQALNINTKITKGTVEILKDEKIINEGDRVRTSEATLLQMLNIKPFWYGLQIKHIYDNGSLYGKKVLEMTDDDMKKMIQGGIANATGLSLATGFTNTLSMPHVMMNSFKNLLAVSVTTDYTFTACNGEELKEAIVSGKGIGGPAPAAAAAAAPAAAAAAAPAPVEEEEEDDDDMGFGLFD